MNGADEDDEAKRTRIPVVPVAGATEAAYEAVMPRLADLDLDALVTVQAELRGRLDAAPSVALRELVEEVRRRVREERGKLRKTKVEERERVAPTQRRILARLRDDPSAPSTLAEDLGVDKATVSRHLALLVQEGLTAFGPDPGDGRKRIYHLTPAGLAAANDHDVLGEPQKPPLLDPVDVERFLEDLQRQAIDLRRGAVDLESAVTKLEVVVREAGRLHLMDLEVSARSELLTTLRQLGQVRAPRAKRHLHALDLISSGRREGCGASSVLASLAHLEYELARRPGESLKVRADRLVLASLTYERLVKDAVDPAPWTVRQAWATVSLADNLREQTLLGAALRQIAVARDLFVDLDEPYGLARCAFLEGFCQRLRGQFDQSWTSLQTAERLAVRHGYERFLADTRMQLGEVQRCRGNYDDAWEVLTDAYGRAESLQATVTMAFARSALGATAFRMGRHEEGLTLLRSADNLFAQNQHGEGAALNRRRHAVASRHILGRHGDGSSLLHHSLHHYLQQRSPAGVAACLVGFGRLAIAQQQDPGTQCKGLLQRLTDPSSRQLLELDPWLSGMILEFAIEAEDELLVDGAKELAQQSSRRRQEGPRKAWARTAMEVAAATDDPDAMQLGEAQEWQPAQLSTDDPTWDDEMAGEPRWDAESIEVLA